MYSVVGFTISSLFSVRRVVIVVELSVTSVISGLAVVVVSESDSLILLNTRGSDSFVDTVVPSAPEDLLSNSALNVSEGSLLVSLLLLSSSSSSSSSSGGYVGSTTLTRCPPPPPLPPPRPPLRSMADPNTLKAVLVTF